MFLQTSCLDTVKRSGKYDVCILHILHICIARVASRVRSNICAYKRTRVHIIHACTDTSMPDASAMEMSAAGGGPNELVHICSPSDSNHTDSNHVVPMLLWISHILTGTETFTSLSFL